MERQSGRLPRMVIYDVPSTCTPEELGRVIRTQNESVSAEECQVNPKFKVGKREPGGDSVDWVCEVSLQFRKTVLKAGKLFIGWSRCRVCDFLSISRCYKCQAFGHIAKYCKAEIDTCGKCGQEGHQFKDCLNQVSNRFVSRAGALVNRTSTKLTRNALCTR